MDKIVILMSTYNGATYLNQQLESIYNQKGLNDCSISIICRDDGSKDNTLEILDSWIEKLNITVLKGENIGARDSFFYLLNNAPEADYYAFCDQDDIWYEDKLSRSIQSLEKNHDLYFSNIEYIDENGNCLNRKLLDPNFSFGLKRILMCNPANGCSMVWNKKLQSILLTVPEETFTMHDEFVCTLAYLFGKVEYDDVPSMGYRLHNLNVTQSKSIIKKIKLWKSIWFQRGPYSLDKRASMLLNYQLRDVDKEILASISEYKKGNKRLKLIKEFTCENRAIERSFKIRMLIGVL